MEERFEAKTKYCNNNAHCFLIFWVFTSHSICEGLVVLWAVNCDSAKVQRVLWGTFERHFEYMKGLKMFSFQGI